MKKTSLSQHEQQDAVKVYQVAKAFISSHASREVQEQLGQTFACYVAAIPTVVLHGILAHDVAQTFMDVSHLIKQLTDWIPDLHAENYREMGQSQAQAAA